MNLESYTCFPDTNPSSSICRFGQSSECQLYLSFIDSPDRHAPSMYAEEMVNRRRTCVRASRDQVTHMQFPLDQLGMERLDNLG